MSGRDLIATARKLGLDHTGSRRQIVERLQAFEQARGEPLTHEDLYPRPRGGGGGLADRADQGGQQSAKFEPKPGRAPAASATRTLRPIEMPELVKLSKELMGADPLIKKLRTSRGIFRPEGHGAIMQDLKPFLPETSILDASWEAGHQWWQRKLGPVQTVQLFIAQGLCFNTAMTHSPLLGSRAGSFNSALNS